MIETNSNSSILVITNDDVIFEYLSSAFSNCVLYSNQNFSDFSCIILDDYSINGELLKKLLENNRVLNISKTDYNSTKQLKQPFSLSELQSFINENLNCGKPLKFRDFEILNGTLNIDSANEQINFGTKELELIAYLYKGSATKANILKDLWNYQSDAETKVLENTINKIKNKMKSVGYDDFIVLDNGKYEINSNYPKIS